MVSEWIKIRKKLIIPLAILIPIIINALLMVDLHFRYYGYLIPHQSKTGLSNWQLIFKEQTILYFSEFLPFFGALILYELFAMEIKSNGWNNMMIMPCEKHKIVLTKYIYSMIIMTNLLLANIFSIFIAGKITGVQGKVEFSLFVKVFIIQWFAMLGVMAILLFAILCLKKIIIIIPISFLVGFISGQIFYSIDLKLYTLNPFSLASYCFRANRGIVVNVIIESIIICVLFLSGVMYMANRKERME